MRASAVSSLQETCFEKDHRASDRTVAPGPGEADESEPWTLWPGWCADYVERRLAEQSGEAEIIATGLQPTNDLESAIVATLPVSPDGIGYTAIMSGVNGTTGVGLVEVYDLDSIPIQSWPTSRLAVRC